MVETQSTLRVVRGRAGRSVTLAPPLMAVVADLVLTVAVVYSAAALRMRLPFFRETTDVDDLVSFTALPIVLGWLVLLALNGAYSAHVMGAGTREYKRVIQASLVLAGGIGIVCYLARFQFSRGFFFLLFFLGIPVLLVGRFTTRRVLHAVRRRGHLAHQVLLTGSAFHVDEIARVLHRETWLGYHVIGALLTRADIAPETPGGIPVLGETSNVVKVVTSSGCDIVLFAGGSVNSSRQMRRSVWELDGLPVSVMVVPSLTDVASERVKVRPAAGLQLMEIEGPRAQLANRWSKRVFDIVAVSVLLILAAPVMAATALAVRLQDGGPVLYRQRRVGLGGREFWVLKFRSMVVGADRVRAEVDNMHDEDHVLFKAKGDPRITRIGAFIRRFSIDELPQFFNVLRGDMSLVGPRPALPEEAAQFTEDVRQRLAVRPGVTGLWQVSGRSDLSWEDSVRLDLYYVDNWSLVQDLAIIVRTVLVIFSGRGAY